MTIGTVPDIIELAIDCCVAQAIKSKSDPARVDVVGSIVASMSSKNAQIVSGKIIARMLKVNKRIVVNSSLNIISTIENFSHFCNYNRKTRR